MTQRTRLQLKALIEGDDSATQFTSKIIDSCLNIVDDIWIGTQAAYDALGTYNSNVFYFITE